MGIFRPGKLAYIDLEVTLEDISSVTGNVIRFLFNGSQYVVIERNESDYSVELNYWNTNGDSAASYLVSKTDIFDMYYDDTDGMYYSIRLNEDSSYSGTPGVSLGENILFLDEFSAGASTNTYKFDESLWTDDYPSWRYYTRNSTDVTGRTYTSNLRSWASFIRNPVTETLDFKTRGGLGILRTSVSTTEDFQAYLDVRTTRLPNEDSAFGIRMIDVSDVFSTDKNNLIVEAMFTGDYDFYDSVSKPGKWQSVHVTFTPDNSSNYWSILNFRVIESEINNPLFGLDTYLDSINYSMYNVEFYDKIDSNHYFKVDQTAPGACILASGVVSPTVRSFDLVDGPFAFTVMANPLTDLSTTNLIGTNIVFNVNVSADLGGGSTDLTTTSGVSGFKIGVGRDGTNLYARRDDDGTVPTLDWNDINVYNLVPSWSTPDISVEIFGDCTSSGTDEPLVECDQLLIESSAEGSWPSIPTLTIEAYDSTGTILVNSLTNVLGEVVSKLDVINRSDVMGGSFSSLRDNGIIALTSDQVSSVEGGSLYVLIKRDAADMTRIYRYNKASFPIESLEMGSTATLVASGTLDNPSKYRQGSFGFCNYSGGDVAYATDNWADLKKGFYLNTLLSGTLSGTRPRHAAWLDYVDFIGWNVNDFDSLYGVTITGSNMGKVRLFNMSPITAAFCNVKVNNRVLDAGTGGDSLVTAQVMNAFGNPLSGKTVNFSISAGDGSISPAAAITNVSGEALSVYTVGSSITTSTITAAVNI